MIDYKMIDYVLFLLVSTLVQLSFIYLWFDSEILSKPFHWCLKRKVNSTNSFTWFIFTLLTCPTCLGYWFSWGVVSMGIFIPGSPLANIDPWRCVFIVFYTGLAVAVLSRIIDGVMPEPINQRIFVSLDDDNLQVEDSDDNDGEQNND